jgi:hypothetical protein
MKASKAITAVCLLVTSFATASCPESSSQVANFNLSGEYGGFIQLTAGSPGGTGGRTASVSQQATGASASGPAADQENFGSSLEFGDLARGDGNPIVGGIGLRVRSNTGFRIVASLSNFTANNLQYQGKPLTAGDNGSFIKISSGAATATGAAAANISKIRGNPLLNAGTPLNRLSQGPALGSAMLVASGPAASVAGIANSVDNAIEVPVFISVPTGLELGPAPGSTEGSFSFTVEFGAFAGT